MTSLISRLQEGTGPDRELDALIAVASGRYLFEKRGRDQKPWFYPAGGDGFLRKHLHGIGFERLEAYTKSLDAALTLVPEGWEWELSWLDGRACAKLGDPLIYPDCDAATPAIALCIAALKARGVGND